MTARTPAQGRQQITIGVTTLAWLNIYQNLKQIVQDAIAPELQGIKVEIKALSQQVNSLEDQIHRSESRMEKRFDEVDKRFDAVDKRFDGVDKRFDAQGRQWEMAMEIRERLAALEARLSRH